MKTDSLVPTMRRGFDGAHTKYRDRGGIPSWGDVSRIMIGGENLQVKNVCVNGLYAGPLNLNWVTV